MVLMTVKKKRNIYAAKMHFTTVTVILINFINILCLVSSQITTVLSEDAIPRSFQDIDFTNTVFLDTFARKAMKRLHDDLDHDDDGLVSMSEGAEFIDREDFESASSNLPGFATDKDGRITESEFWENWVRSEVHNWTVTQMIDWLSHDVDLPQYAAKFQQYGLKGSAMPVLMDGEYDGLKRLGIISASHKRKIQLRAAEIVLFGPPKPRSSWIKDIFVVISFTLALCGVAYGFHVQRSAASAVTMMQEKLNNLQNEMTKLDEEDVWLKNLSDDERGPNFGNHESFSSQSSLGSELSIQTRLHEVMEELADTKSLLEQAEERLNVRQWMPPGRLITCLKTTYRIETKLHEAKRLQAQKKVEQAKNQFSKMKKKTSLFTSVQLVHSQQVDDFDLEIQAAKDLLREVQKDSREFKKRWMELENLCSIKFMARLSKTDDAPTRAPAREKKLSVEATNQKPEDEVIQGSVELSADAGDGLHMKDVSIDEDVVAGDEIVSMKDVRRVNVSHEKRRSEPIIRYTKPAINCHRSKSSSVPSVKSASLRKSPTAISEEGVTKFSERSRTLPNRSPKLMFDNQKTLIAVNEEILDPQPWPGKTSTHNRKSSLDAIDTSLLHPGNKSVSSHSLPDLPSGKEAENPKDGVKSLKSNKSSGDNTKATKKSQFSSFFKRKPKKAGNP